MYQILSCVTTEHSLLYVAAAVLVLATGLVCSIIVFQRGMLAETVLRARIWAAVSAAVTAVGIWATHFVAMLGYRPGFDVYYDGTTTLVSVGIAISGFLITSQILISGMSFIHRGLSAAIAAITVSVMHFYGAGALKAAALIEYDPYTWRRPSRPASCFSASRTSASARPRRRGTS